jgi:hypothetical protein
MKLYKSASSRTRAQLYRFVRVKEKSVFERVRQKGLYRKSKIRTNNNPKIRFCPSENPTSDIYIIPIRLIQKYRQFTISLLQFLKICFKYQFGLSKRVKFESKPDWHYPWHYVLDRLILVFLAKLIDSIYVIFLSFDSLPVG